ncbi:hypothetical protein Tco_0235436, partial [Tanacetum coccineum]
IALWQSQMEDHTSDWLRVVPIFGLGQTMKEGCSGLTKADLKFLRKQDIGARVVVHIFNRISFATKLKE